MPLIELGLIDGNFWADEHVDAIEAAINQSCQAGDIRMSIATAESPGWLMLNGQVVPNAQTLYPDLWLAAPVAWKVGAALNLPNATTRFPIGGSAVGTVGGANSRSITEAQLPAHAHSMGHDHGQINSQGQSNHHVHSVHPHAWGGGQSYQYFVVQSINGGPSAFNIAAGTGATIANMESIMSDVDEYENGSAASDHTHPVDVPNYVGSTGNGPGSAAAMDLTPAFITFNFFIAAF